MLTPREIEKYNRQIIIDGFGVEGQERLKAATVFIAGAGGLGSSIAIYLTAAGVGKIRIVDQDRVELGNLNRQVLYGDRDTGRDKAKSAVARLRWLNQDVEVEGIRERIREDNIFELIKSCGLIVDAMDNFPTRYLLNRAALKKGIPLFHGAVYSFEGRATTIVPGKTACLRCLYSQAPPEEKLPVIGVAPAVIGVLQATEVIKYIVGIGELLTGRLLIYDGLNLRFTEVKVRKDPHCQDCSHIFTRAGEYANEC